MSFDNTKYHCEINGVPYNIRGYQRSEVSTFIPRLSSGDQRESDFDLLRSKTIDGFEAGTLQRYFNDNNAVFATEGLYPIYEDGTLYPVNPAVVTTDNILLGGSKSAMTAHLVTPDYAFVAGQSYSTPTNFLRRLNSDGTVTSITLPANISSGSRQIVSIVYFNSQIWVGTSDGLTMGYMAYTATTITEVGTGVATECVGGQLIVYKGSLYGTDGSTAQATSAVIRRHTGGTSARTFEQVGDTGLRNHDSTAKLFKFNNRIWLARKDGLWAYDGIQLVDVEIASFYNSRNYQFPTVLKGYLYYFMPDGWYRFNGSLIEKIYDISEIGMPYDVFVGKNRIFMTYRNSSVYGSTRYDKSMGYDYSTGDSEDGRIMCFNGKGLFTYARTTTYVRDPMALDFSGQGALWKGFAWGDTVYISLLYEKDGSDDYFKIDLDEINATGTKSWRLVSSIDDGDFPMIDKSLENVELVLDGDVSADEDITIEYRTDGFDGSTGWTTYGTIKTQTELKRYVWKSLVAGVTFRQIQFRLAGTTTAGYGIKKIVFRYLLTPDYKNQWTFTALCYGDDNISPLLLADGTEGAQTVATLRGNLYGARHSRQPVHFLDIDQLELTDNINSSVTTIPLTSTSLLKGSDGFIKIQDEIIYWYSKTATTLTVLRGVLGTTPASHVDNEFVFVLYRVIVRQIQNERIELTDPLNDTPENTDRSSEITLVLQEV